MPPVSERKRAVIQPADADRLAYNIDDTARALSVSRNAVYSLVKAGRLRYVRLAGGSLRIPRRAIEEYLASGDRTA